MGGSASVYISQTATSDDIVQLMFENLGSDYQYYKSMFARNEVTWKKIEERFINEEEAMKYMTEIGITSKDHQGQIWKEYDLLKQNQNRIVTDLSEIAPIRLIPFDKFIALNEFPRYPENKDIVVHYPTDLDFDNSFIVFVSHCWLRGYPGAAGYDKRPHPDNAKGSKFELCKKGIQMTHELFCPTMKSCYIWLDFGCIDQDGNPAGELKQLDQIVRISDCIFTPLYDANAEEEYMKSPKKSVKASHLPDTIENWYKDVHCDGWNLNQYSYLNRGWCRVEMFYAANIPSFLSSDLRMNKFQGSLGLLKKKGQRAHLLYTSYEYYSNSPPMILPPLSNSYLTEFSPIDGNLSVENDRMKIQELMNLLAPYIANNPSSLQTTATTTSSPDSSSKKKKKKEPNFRYEGGIQVDKNGFLNGVGKLFYSNGDIFEGELLQSKPVYGQYTYANGSIYKGNYDSDGNKSGEGEQWFQTGNYYKGQWLKDMMNGSGLLKTAQGSTMEGQFVNNKLHDPNGKIIFPDGANYIGNVENHELHGSGKYIYHNGDIYEGDYFHGVKHGKGIFRKKDSNISYEGEFQDGNYHGNGILTYASGDIFKGSFQNNKRHGYGEYFYSKTKDIFKGQYVDDKKHGKGIIIFGDDGTEQEVQFDMDKQIEQDEEDD